MNSRRRGAMKPWGCHTTGDFLSELAELLRKYNLNSEDGLESLAEHLSSCPSCDDKFRKFKKQYGDATAFVA